MAMLPDRTLRVVAHFEDSERAKKNLRSRARLAVGDAPGRGVSFADDFKLTTSKASGSEVVLDLTPEAVDGLRAVRAVRRAGAVRDLLRCDCPRRPRHANVAGVVGGAVFRPLQSHSHVLGWADPPVTAPRTCECDVECRMGAPIGPSRHIRMFDASRLGAETTSSASPAPPVRGDQLLLEVAQRLVVGGGGLGPGAVGVELPAGGVLVEGEVEDAGDLLDLGRRRAA